LASQSDPEADAEETGEPKTDESPSKPPLHLSGLRRFLSVWGRKKLGNTAVPEPQVASSTPQSEASSEVLSKTQAPVPEFPSAPIITFDFATAKDSPAPAAAPHEVELPKAMIEANEENSRSVETGQGQGRTFDELKILPSQRGQYGRKR
jgi:hypothetical protein